jgi:hypothetical protein
MPVLIVVVVVLVAVLNLFWVEDVLCAHLATGNCYYGENGVFPLRPFEEKSKSKNSQMEGTEQKRGRKPEKPPRVNSEVIEVGSS